MPLLIAAVGQRLPSWMEDGFQEYAKRMPPEYLLTLREIKPEPRTSGKPAAALMQAEANRLREALPKAAFCVALDERGRDFTTTQLAEHLARWQQEHRDIAFLIGGADGLAPDIKQSAQFQLRLSSLTLPHGLARVLLAEQLYRACSLLQGHPYHRV